MKILRGFLLTILNFILVSLVMTFSVNLIFKNVIKKELLGGIAKDKIVSEYIDNLDIDNKEEIKELLNNDEASSIASEVIDDYLKYVEDNNHKVSEDTVKRIVDFSVEHNSQISTISGENISESQIRSDETYKSISDAINNGFADVGTEIKAGQDIIKIYNKMTTANINAILIVAIIIIIILIMVVKSSVYRWLSNLGTALIVSGVFFLSLYIAIKALLDGILEKQEFDINIKIDGISKIAIAEIVTGIVLIIVQKIIAIIIKKSKANAESLEIEKQEDQIIVNEIKEEPQVLGQEVINTEETVQNNNEDV